jgi:hypothetical protein
MSLLASRSRRRKFVILLACWLLEGALCFLLFRVDDRFVVAPMETGPALAVSTLRENETGAFSAGRRDPDADYKLAFQVRWKNLCAESGRLGIFKTPLYKTVIIEGLEVKSYQYSHCEKRHEGDAVLTPTASDPARQATEESAGVKEDHGVLTQTVSDLACQVRERFTSVKMVPSPLLDARRATKVIIRGLDYCLFRDGRLDLGVRCRNTVISTSSPEVNLRGDVTIQAADGGRLISSSVLWDVKRGQFSVPGAYVLERDGVPVWGTGIHCDHRLQPLRTETLVVGKE